MGIFSFSLTSTFPFSFMTNSGCRWVFRGACPRVNLPLTSWRWGSCGDGQTDTPHTSHSALPLFIIQMPLASGWSWIGLYFVSQIVTMVCWPVRWVDDRDSNCAKGTQNRVVLWSVVAHRLGFLAAQWPGGQVFERARSGVRTSFRGKFRKEFVYERWCYLCGAGQR